jgi:hypothetical protein
VGSVDGETNLSHHLGEFGDVTVNRIDRRLLSLEAALDVEHLPRETTTDGGLLFRLSLSGSEQLGLLGGSCHTVLRSCSTGNHDLILAERQRSLAAGRGILPLDREIEQPHTAAARGRRGWVSLGKGWRLIPIVTLFVSLSG